MTVVLNDLKLKHMANSVYKQTMLEFIHKQNNDNCGNVAMTSLRR